MVNTPPPVEPAPSPPARSRRRILPRTLAALFFVAGCLFAAWQAHLFFQFQSSPGPAPLPESDTSAGPAATRPGPATEPAPSDPLAAVGIQLLHADPGALAPPPGAKRTLARLIRSGPRVWEEGLYDFRGTVASAEEYYGKALIQAGFRVVRTWGDPPARRTIGFARGALAGTVSLRTSPKDATMVWITVRIPRAADRADGQENQTP